MALAACCTEGHSWTYGVSHAEAADLSSVGLAVVHYESAKMTIGVTAMNDLDEAIRLWPSYVDAYLLRAYMASSVMIEEPLAPDERSEFGEDAIRDLHCALKIDERCAAFAYYNLAEVYLRRGEIVRARSYALMAVAAIRLAGGRVENDALGGMDIATGLELLSRVSESVEKSMPGDLGK
ncbi:MAG: hypothetical protein H6807_15250 [Planctomycetes bacterium]|nr:hypothetical protein [Planctomycetota bacterium]